MKITFNEQNEPVLQPINTINVVGLERIKLFTELNDKFNAMDHMDLQLHAAHELLVLHMSAHEIEEIDLATLKHMLHCSTLISVNDVICERNTLTSRDMGFTIEDVKHIARFVELYDVFDAMDTQEEVAAHAAADIVSYQFRLKPPITPHQIDDDFRRHNDHYIDGLQFIIKELKHELAVSTNGQQLSLAQLGNLKDHIEQLTEQLTISRKISAKHGEENSRLKHSELAMKHSNDRIATLEAELKNRYSQIDRLENELKNRIDTPSGGHCINPHLVQLKQANDRIATLERINKINECLKSQFNTTVQIHIARIAELEDELLDADRTIKRLEEKQVHPTKAEERIDALTNELKEAIELNIRLKGDVSEIERNEHLNKRLIEDNERLNTRVARLNIHNKELKDRNEDLDIDNINLGIRNKDLESHNQLMNCPPLPAEQVLPIDNSGFVMGLKVRKKSGSEWEGKVVGFYNSTLTDLGVCVESSSHAGSVQIYPTHALEIL